MSFTCIVHISSGTYSLQLPLTGVTTLSVDWGDGTINATNTHIYTNPGTYTIVCSGFTGFTSMSPWTGVQYLTHVTQWNTIELMNIDGAFMGAVQLQSVPSTLPPLVTTLNRVFQGASRINDANISACDVSGITSMDSLFRETGFNRSLSSWNTANVQSMSEMFYGTFYFNQDISSWNVSQVTDMSYMFYGASAFNSSSITGWNTAQLQNTDGMFENTILFNQSLSAWDTRQLVSAQNMFKVAGSFKNGGGTPLTWSIDQLQNINGMFSGLDVNYDISFSTSLGQPWSLTSMVSTFENTILYSNTLRDWDVHSVSNMSALFKNATLYFTVDLSWNTSNTIDMSYMFYNVSSYVFETNVLNWDTSSVTDMSYMFYNFKNAKSIMQPVQYYVDSLIHVDYMFAYTELNSVYFTTTVPSTPWVLQTTSYMFYNCRFNDLSIVDWDTHAVTTMSHMFAQDFTGYFNQPLHWRVDALIDASYMFYRQRELSVGILFESDTSWVLENTSYMFAECDSFSDENLQDWDVSNVRNMSHMFDTALFMNIPLDTWNTSNATDMSFMFYQCPSFNANIGSWNVSQVTNMESMFQTAQQFNQFMNAWNVSNVTNMSHMFDGASSFNNDGIRYFVWDTRNVTDMSYMFHNGSYLWTDCGFQFNTVSVTDMSHMFENTSVSASQLQFNTEQVVNMSAMFKRNTSSASFPFSIYVEDYNEWNTSNVEDMSYMFAGQKEFNTIVLFDTSNVVTMQGMFQDCITFNQSIANFSITSLRNASYMFDGASVYRGTNDFENWDTSEITDMTAMFRNASQFLGSHLDTWSLESIVHMENMLDNTNLSPYNYSLILQGWYNNTFPQLPLNIHLGADNLYYLSFINKIHTVLTTTYQWTITDTLLNNPMQLTFQVPAQTTIELPIQQLIPGIELTVNWGDGTVYDSFSPTHLFKTTGIYNVIISDSFSQFGYSDISGDPLYTRYQGQPWNGVQYLTAVLSLNGSLVYLNHGFHGGSLLTYMTPIVFPGVREMNHLLERTPLFIDVSNNLHSWDVSKITTMSYLFSFSAFNADLSWNIQNVTDISYLFYGNRVFNRPFITTWNTTSVTNMEGVFRDASAFNQSLEWNTANVLTMKDMFRNATSFNQPLVLYIQNWNTDNVINASGMFNGAVAYDQDISLQFPRATTMSGFFQNTNYTRSIVTLFNATQSLIDVSYMFANNRAFNSSTITSIIFNNSGFQNYSHMFDGAIAFNQPLTWNIDLSGTTLDCTAMFRNATSFNRGLNFRINRLLDSTILLNSMFEGANLYNEFFDIQLLSQPFHSQIDLTAMFKNATLYNNNFLRDSVVSNMGFTIMSTQSMFEGASSFNQPVNGLATIIGESPITNLSSMFKNATQFDQSFQFTVPHVTNMANMLDNTSISRTHYNEILSFFSQQSLQRNVILGAQGLQYDISFVLIRTILTSQYQWNIIGDSAYRPPNPVQPILFKKGNGGGNDSTVTRAMRYSQLVNTMNIPVDSKTPSSL